MRKKREKRLKEIYKAQKKLILPLNNQELFLAGLLLYWGEGTKSEQMASLFQIMILQLLNFLFIGLGKV